MHWSFILGCIYTKQTNLFNSKLHHYNRFGKQELGAVNKMLSFGFLMADFIYQVEQIVFYERMNY